MCPTLFVIYIDKLEACLEELGCVNTTLDGIVVVLLLYIGDIVLLVRFPFDLDKRQTILKYLCSSMGTSINTDKTKFMIIKFEKITYANLVYDNNNLEEVNSDNYLKQSIEKMINEGCKAYFVLENNCKSTNLWFWSKNKFFFETLVTLVILCGCEVWRYNISR
jgi:hypothetical protein